MGFFSRLFKRKSVRRMGFDGTRVTNCYSRDCENWRRGDGVVQYPEGSTVDKSLTESPCFGCCHNPEEYYRGGVDHYKRREGGEKVYVLTDTGEMVAINEDDLRARKPL
jgi:hypothetical protein